MGNCCGENNSCDCAGGCCGDIKSEEMENKMCVLTQQAGKADVKKVATLSNDPDHICGCCGKPANKAENLCDPRKMEDEK